MGRIQGLGKSQGPIVHWMYPIAGFFPVVRLGVRTTGRSGTTAYTRHGMARAVTASAG
jgi:hypothetical protein